MYDAGRVYASRPIIGIAGGIGSGKSFVADLFGELGCLVLRADEHVHDAHASDAVKEKLRQWWGERVFDPAGNVDRRAVASIVFNQPVELARLEALLHPIVNARRWEIMREKSGESAIRAWVWDVPLLFETGLNRDCDCVVFVDTPLEIRRRRVLESRGWDAGELASRENLQLPLDKKRSISDYCVSNADGIDVVREQVRDVLSRILAGSH